MLNKLTAYLIRRNPRRALAAAVFFMAHELVREQVEDVDVPLTDEQVNGAGDDLADHMLDLAYTASDDAFTFLSREVERDETRDAYGQEVNPDYAHDPLNPDQN